MLGFVIVVLATFGIWETLRDLCPWTIPPALQPFIVVAIALALAWPDWRSALGAIGGVLILHSFLPRPTQVVPARRSSLPPLP